MYSILNTNILKPLQIIVFASPAGSDFHNGNVCALPVSTDYPGQRPFGIQIFGSNTSVSTDVPSHDSEQLHTRQQGAGWSTKLQQAAWTQMDSESTDCYPLNDVSLLFAMRELPFMRILYLLSRAFALLCRLDDVT
jgi:hypothetical protein